ncbi:MAG: polyprenyl diphosphate synthase, partial [Methanomicrobium sp.]|nr:polyprenyl diphosphate synthase [Methanomicrobium sp.]
MKLKPRDFIESIYERHLLRKIRHVPGHIAIIQDGNRRFAREMGLDISTGHRLGAQTTEKVLDWAREIGVKHITLYCFSTENFRRSESELRELFELFAEKAIAAASDERVHKNRIRIQMVGDRNLMPADLMEKIERVESLTKNHTEFTINLAIAYGGRNEIVCATRSILNQIRQGRL